MLQNAYFLAKIGADTAENEQHFAEICQPTLSDVAATGATRTATATAPTMTARTAGGSATTGFVRRWQ